MADLTSSRPNTRQAQYLDINHSRNVSTHRVTLAIISQKLYTIIHVTEITPALQAKLLISVPLPNLPALSLAVPHLPSRW